MTTAKTDIATIIYAPRWSTSLTSCIVNHLKNKGNCPGHKPVNCTQVSYGEKIEHTWPLPSQPGGNELPVGRQSPGHSHIHAYGSAMYTQFIPICQIATTSVQCPGSPCSMLPVAACAVHQLAVTTACHTWESFPAVCQRLVVYPRHAGFLRTSERDITNKEKTRTLNLFIYMLCRCFT